MKKNFFVITFIIIFNSLCNAQNNSSFNINDIADYDSLCPGAKIRNRIIRDVKESSTYTIEESIQILKDILLRIEDENGLFDDMNYFEAIRLLGWKYLQKGDLFRIDSLLYTTQKYIYENINNPSQLPGLYILNRIASWLEFREGRYDNAIELLKKYIKEESDDVEYLSAIQDLALCYLQIKRYNDFSAIAKESVEIADTITINNYTFPLKLESEKIKAYICIFSDNDIKKGTELLESLALKLKDYNNCLRFYYSVLNDLCDIYINTNVDNYIKIKNEILHSGILTDEEKVQILESLVGAEWIYGKEEDIINHTIQHSNLLKNIAIKNSASFTPTQNTTKWPSILERLDKDTYILNRFSDNHEICELCYNNLLFIKNHIFSSDYAIRSYIYRCGDEAIRKQLAAIDSLREFIVYNGVDIKDTAPYSYALSYNETNLLNSIPITNIIKSQIKNWRDVASSLNENEIAVEITDCNVLFPQDSIYSQIMALVITKNCDSPRCVKLGNYYEIADELRSLISKDSLEINRIYSTRNNSIYKLLWGNFKKHFNGIKTIYISSNTFLSFVNLGALLSSEGIRASEEWTIKLLTSTSEIPSITNSIPYSSLSLFGASNFSVKDNEKDDLYSEIVRSLNNRGVFQDLKGTIEEVNKIQHEIENSNLNIQKFTGKQATESNFRSLNGHASQIIHIATHSFAIKDIKNCKYLSKLMAIDKRSGGMIGTGFILNNANTYWNGSDKTESNKDGVLLSEDISRLNLSGCDLVVLSGCQSAEGQMNKDGVFGLQRAFKMAGSKSMLLSLWNVDDNITKEYMISFYKFLLKTGNKYKAYYSAQNELLRKYNNPYYWAAFILID